MRKEKTNNLKVLVTGGSGFIGKALIGRLEKEGYSVENFDLSQGQDLRNKSQVDKTIKGKDVVMHLAAVADLNWAREHPDETMDINIGGTINVAQACTKHKAILFYASTCCVYGNQDSHPTSEKAFLNPAEIYACTKLAGEYVIKGYNLMYGLRYNNIRFATIYGPGMRPALGVYIFFKQALKGEPITVHGDGLQTRTLTYIDDLIEGIIALLKSGIVNKNINLSAEEEISALDMAQMIKELTKSKSPIVHIEQRPGQTFREAIDASYAKELIGWQTETSFKEGLEKTYQWIKGLPSL